MRVTAVFALVAGTAALLPAQQQRQVGPVIQTGGGVFEVTNPGFATPLDHTFRVMYDVGESGGKDQVNDSFNSAARFLNMHARAGVPAGRVHAAIVVYGPGSMDLLNDAEYRRRFGVDNPNAKLLAELMRAGVKVVLCGQTAASRELTREMLVPGAQLALSAMTALVTLQDQGYRLIPF